MLRFSIRLRKSRFALVVATALMMVTAMLGGCSSKQEPEPPPLGDGDMLRFVFMADSRGDSLGYSIDTTALNPIIREIGRLSPKPSFIIFGGDMAYRGWMNGSYTFQDFKNLFASLADSGIALYTTMGNHELYHHHASYGFLLVNQQEFQTVFSENPVNGPAGYEHLVYSFTDPVTSSFFAVLDPYYITEDTVHPKGLGGHIDSVQMAWLEAKVAQTGALHKFLFIHTPYYYISDDPEEPSAADTSLTKLWSFLDNNKFDMYACGHSHLYARRTIEDTILPKPQTIPPTPAWQNNVVQLLNGTCGAGPSTGSLDPNVRPSGMWPTVPLLFTSA